MIETLYIALIYWLVGIVVVIPSLLVLILGAMLIADNSPVTRRVHGWPLLALRVMYVLAITYGVVVLGVMGATAC